MKSYVLVKLHLGREIREQKLPVADFCIGRSVKADLKIDSEHLSRKHLNVRVKDGNIFVADNKTTNGSFINNQRIQADTFTLLQIGDKLRLGQGDVYLEMEYIQDFSQTDSYANVVDLQKRENTKIANRTSTCQVPQTLGNNAIKIEADPIEQTRTVAKSEAFKQTRTIDQADPAVLTQTADQTTTETEEVLSQKQVQYIGEENTKVVQFDPKVEEGFQQVVSKVKSNHFSEPTMVERLELERKRIEAELSVLKLREQAELESKKIIEQAIKDSEELKILTEQEISENKNEVENLNNTISELNDKIVGLEEKCTDSRIVLKDFEDKIISLEQIILDKESAIEIIEEQLQEKLEKFKDAEKEHKNRLDEDRRSVEFIVEKAQLEKDRLMQDQRILEKEIVSSEKLKQFLDRELEDIRKREQKAQENYERIENRLESLLTDKEQAALYIQDSKVKLEESEIELSSVKKQLELIEVETREKQAILESIKTEMQEQLAVEKQKLQGEIDEIRARYKQEYDSLKEMAEEKAKEIVRTAKVEADMLKSEAELIHKETHAKQLEIREKEEKVQQELGELKKRVEQELEQQQIELKDQKDSQLSQLEELKQSTIEKNKTEARQIISQAKTEAQEVLRIAREEKDKSGADAAQLIKDTQEKVLKAHNEGTKELEIAKQKIEQNIKDLQQELKNANIKRQDLIQEHVKIQNDIDQERDDLRKQIEEERERTINEANKQAEQIVQSAKKKYDETLNQLEIDHENKVSVLNQQIQDLKQHHEDQIKAQSDQEKQMLTKMRAEYTQRIETLKVEQENELVKQKENKVGEIARGIETLVNMKLREAVEKNLTKAHIRLTSNNIRDLVEQSLTVKKSHNNGVLNKLNPYGSFGKGKSKSFFIKLCAAIVLVIFFAIIHTTKPVFYASSIATVQKLFKVKTTAQDIFVEKVKEQRAARPKFEPKITKEFKANYTDNVIYTERFAELWLSDDFQSDWTIQIDSLFVNQLGLTEDKVVRFISEEFKLVRDLKQMREKIRYGNQDEQISKMRNFELTKMNKIKQIIGGDQNYQRLRKLQISFFEMRR